MDDHTFFLVRDAEERLRRTEVLIEQHRDLHEQHPEWSR